MKKPWKLWVGILSGLVVVSIILALVGRIPSAAQQLPPNNAPIVVAITHPADGSTWSADTPIPVAAMASGQVPVNRLELWVDAQLFDTQEFPGDHIYSYHAWSWMPLTEGAHSLYVRAVDANGQTADSNVVNITAEAAAGFLAVKQAAGGETLQALADQAGLPLADFAAQNPTIDPQAPIPPGTQLFIPVMFAYMPGGLGNPPPPEIDAHVDPALVGMPSGAALLVEHGLNPMQALPAAPGLAASLGVCNVTLTIQDNSDPEDGFFVYGLTDGATSFHRLTSLKPHMGKGALAYVVPDQHGHLQFYVSSYNVAGEAKSPPVALDVTASQCNPNSGDQSPVQYEGGFLLMPAGMQLAYLYASLNGGTWQRLPAGHEFMSPTAGKVDLRPQIQGLLGGNATGEVDLDVWAWHGRTLTHLGLLHLNINFASLEICNLGAASTCYGAGASQWVTDAVIGSDQVNTTRAFRWSAQGIDITHALWQVSTQPFPDEYSIGAPPGLIITGDSPASVGESGAASGAFEIDFKTDLKIPDAPAKPSQPFFSLEHLLQINKIEDTYMPVFLSQFGQSPFPGLSQLLQTMKLFVRVAPMGGGHIVGDPSNTVPVTYTPTGITPPIHISKVPYYTVEVVPGSYVNQVKVVQQKGILGCSVITAIDHDKYVDWYKQQYAQYLNLAPGTFDLDSLAEGSYQYWYSHLGETLCPGTVEEHDPSIFEQFVDAFKQAWDGLASAIEQIKGTLVSALASIIPGCDSTCQQILMTGLNFAITYFTGLPPSMPSFSEGVSAGLEYAVQMAISQAGIPYCDDICTGKITEEIKQVASDLASSPKQPGCSGNGTLWLYEGTQLYHLKPLCIPPGISFEPVKGSMYEPGTLQVKVSRIDGSPGTAPQSLLTIDSTAFNFAFADGHTAYDYLYGSFFNGSSSVLSYQVTYNQVLFGNPYAPTTVPVPPMKAGQTMVIPVVLKYNDFSDISLANAYPPRRTAIQALNLSQKEMDSVQNHNSFWWDFTHLTDSGSIITLNPAMLCADPSTPGVYTSACSDPAGAQITVP